MPRSILMMILFDEVMAIMFWAERQVAMVTQIITLFNRGEQKSISEWEPWKKGKRKGERGDQGVRDRKVMLSYNASVTCQVTCSIWKAAILKKDSTACGICLGLLRKHVDRIHYYSVESIYHGRKWPLCKSPDVWTSLHIQSWNTYFNPCEFVPFNVFWK